MSEKAAALDLELNIRHTVFVQGLVEEELAGLRRVEMVAGCRAGCISKYSKSLLKSQIGISTKQLVDGAVRWYA